MTDEERRYDTPAKILEAAMTREKAAYEFYDSLLSHSKVQIITEMLESLKNEEYKHIKLIEQLSAELRMGRHHDEENESP